MDLKHTHLRHTHETFNRVKGEVLLDGAVLLIGDRNVGDAFWNSHANVFLKEAWFTASFRAANNAQGAVGDVRQHSLGYCDQVFGKIALGHAGLAVEDFLRVRDWQVSFTLLRFSRGF